MDTEIQNILKNHLHARTKASRYIFTYITPEIKKQTASMSKEDLIIALDNIINHIVIETKIKKDESGTERK